MDVIWKYNISAGTSYGSVKNMSKNAITTKVSLNTVSSTNISKLPSGLMNAVEIDHVTNNKLHHQIHCRTLHPGDK